MEKMTQHQLGQIKKDIQPSWCWAKVSEVNDLILNPDKYGFGHLNFGNLNLFRISDFGFV